MGGIHWYNLNVFIKNKRRKRKKNIINNENDKDIIHLLHKCSGYIANGHICGIIGPSGSGKSTLLNAIGGLSSYGSVSGSVWLSTTTEEEDYYLCMGNGEIAYLQQDDVFFTQLTSREVLDTASSFLKLSSSSSSSNTNLDNVNRIIDSLGLSSIQHRR